jgi:hypothetical protein
VDHGCSYRSAVWSHTGRLTGREQQWNVVLPVCYPTRWYRQILVRLTNMGPNRRAQERERAAARAAAEAKRAAGFLVRISAAMRNL